jgi:hypothetical protein
MVRFIDPRSDLEALGDTVHGEVSRPFHGHYKEAQIRAMRESRKANERRGNRTPSLPPLKSLGE